MRRQTNIFGNFKAKSKEETEIDRFFRIQRIKSLTKQMREALDNQLYPNKEQKYDN